MYLLLLFTNTVTHVHRLTWMTRKDRKLQSCNNPCELYEAKWMKQMQASSIVQETPIPVENTDKIDALIAEVENLKVMQGKSDVIPLSPF